MEQSDYTFERKEKMLPPWKLLSALVSVTTTDNPAEAV